MNQAKSRKRHPLANYLIKPRLQVKLTLYFVIVSFVGSALSLLLIFLLTRVDADGLEGLRTAWYYLSAIFPSFYIAGGVSLVVGIILGIYASRKVALPIYKVEQWASNLKKGDLTHQLGMRESDYWEEMAEYCNEFLAELQTQLKAVKKLQDSSPDPVKSELKKFLDNYKY